MRLPGVQPEVLDDGAADPAAVLIGLPSTPTTHHFPPLPCPLVCPGAVSWW